VLEVILHFLFSNIFWFGIAGLINLIGFLLTVSMGKINLIAPFVYVLAVLFISFGLFNFILSILFLYYNNYIWEIVLISIIIFGIILISPTSGSGGYASGGGFGVSYD
jgi:hypothetical protein